MIKTLFDLHEYLAADLSRLEKKPNLKDWLLKNESWFIWRYIYLLRHVEYHLNSRHKLRYLWYFFFYKRLGFKLHFTIYPNTIGPGFRIYHIGDFVHVGSNVRIGKNCTLLPGVVFGNKHEMADGGNISVGDNCYFGLGVKILGSVMIGNNVTVGTNAVVTKDIPDNAVVGGVPAKVIKMKILNEIKGGGRLGELLRKLILLVEFRAWRFAV